MTEVRIRSYGPADRAAGLRLWDELVRQERELYGEALYGSSFEEYLTRLELSGVWVADHDSDGVIGLAGLVLDGARGRVEPVVVASRHRGRGIGRKLLRKVADQAGRRGLRQLVVAPQTRNQAALRCLHAAGYDRLAAVELALDLRDSRRSEAPTVGLRDLQFRS